MKNQNIYINTYSKLESLSVIDRLRNRGASIENWGIVKISDDGNIIEVNNGVIEIKPRSLESSEKKRISFSEIENYSWEPKIPEYHKGGVIGSYEKAVTEAEDKISPRNQPPAMEEKHLVHSIVKGFDSINIRTVKGKGLRITTSKAGILLNEDDIKFLMNSIDDLKEYATK